jgi:hypothetical protein
VTKHAQTLWIVSILIGLICLSVLAFLWVAAGSFKVCTPQQDAESYAKTIAALDGIVDLGLKLSTTLVGLGAALLIGWKSELKLTFAIRVIVLVATLFPVGPVRRVVAVWHCRTLAQRLPPTDRRTYVGQTISSPFLFFSGRASMARSARHRCIVR